MTSRFIRLIEHGTNSSLEKVERLAEGSRPQKYAFSLLEGL